MPLATTLLLIFVEIQLVDQRIFQDTRTALLYFLRRMTTELRIVFLDKINYLDLDRGVVLTQFKNPTTLTNDIIKKSFQLHNLINSRGMELIMRIFNAYFKTKIINRIDMRVTQDSVQRYCYKLNAIDFIQTTRPPIQIT